MSLGSSSDHLGHLVPIVRRLVSLLGSADFAASCSPWVRLVTLSQGFGNLGSGPLTGCSGVMVEA
eukprot:4549872-Pyramimonas_sp.AAC.1